VLEKAVVRRFQKWRKLTVKFGPRVTVLVGPTDAGKSSFLRALLFAFFSKWKPAYHRHGAESTAVDLVIDGHKITRKKGKGGNLFYLDGKKLSAVGKNGVPEEVARLFNLTAANVQTQLDPPFWFSETPGAISKKLNKIVNLEKIDEALAAAGAGVRDSERRLKDAKAARKEAEDAEKGTRWIEPFLTRAQEVLDLQDAADDADREAQELESLVKRVRRSRQVVSGLERAVRAGEKAVAAGRRAFVADDLASQLETLIRDVKKVRRISKLKLPDFDRVKKLRLEGDEVAEECGLLEGAIADVKKARRERVIAKLEMIAVKDKWEHLKKKNKVRKCPECGSLVGVGSQAAKEHTKSHGRGKSNR
jgi:DNA repair exonuclease SbcCD ATPase subunit